MHLPKDSAFPRFRSLSPVPSMPPIHYFAAVACRFSLVWKISLNDSSSSDPFRGGAPFKGAPRSSIYRRHVTLPILADQVILKQLVHAASIVANVADKTARIRVLISASRSVSSFLPDPASPSAQPPHPAAMPPRPGAIGRQACRCAKLDGLTARQASKVAGIEASTELTGGDARRLRGINEGQHARAARN
jgi:hypothetical protein